MSTRFLVPLFACSLLAAAPASAALTPIFPSGGEPSLSTVLDEIYGAGALIRIDDDFDRIWAPGTLSVTARAKNSAARQRLGFCILCDGTDDVLFDQTVTADGLFSIPITLGGIGAFSIASPFTWFDLPTHSPFVGKVYSDPSRNPLGADHMVTFAVANRPGVYVVAVEDWLFTKTPASDRDYQDFVFEVSYARTPPNTVVPEPGTWLTMLGGLAGLLWARRRRG